MAAAAPRAAPSGVRRLPNVLVTGTPGTGKSTLCVEIVKGLNADGAGAFRHVSVSDLVREKGYHGGRDDKFDTLILDDDGEDALLDDLEDQLSSGGVILEFHSSELFPERWFDLVLVLRCVETRVLYDRLAKRGYTQVKLQENTSAEIMGVCLEEAQASYPDAPVVELTSVTPSDVAANASRVLAWKAQWLVDHPAGVASGPLQTGSATASSSSSSSSAGAGGDGGAAVLPSASAFTASGSVSSAPAACASPFAAAAAGLTGKPAWS